MYRCIYIPWDILIFENLTLLSLSLSLSLFGNTNANTTVCIRFNTNRVRIISRQMIYAFVDIFPLL